MEKPRLSQSLLKDYLDYYDHNVQECGVKIRNRHFLKIPTPQTDTQKLGVYFEYMATGYKHPDAPTPEPEMVYKGTPKQKMAADYERATQSALKFKEIVEKHNIKILSFGEYLKYDGASGIVDIMAEWNGEKCIIDLKYTGLFDDKFNEYGWHTESLPYKSKLLLQPIHYKYLVKKIEGVEDMPFYFFVFSSKDPEKVKIIKTNIQEEHINLHESITIEKMKKYIDFHYNNLDKLEARPTYLRCKECAYFDICEDKTETPLIETIDY